MTENPVRYTSEPVESLIFTIRGQRVILDADLARIYGVPTKALNQAIKRDYPTWSVGVELSIPIPFEMPHFVRT